MSTVVRSFARFRPFEIELEDGSRQRLAEETGTPDDGMFEIITLRHTAKWRILATAVKASVAGLGKQPSVRTYAFTTVTPLPLQIDGEVMDLPAGATVRVDITPQALQTVL